MVPRDTYASIPAARSFTDAPFDRWRELGADALVLGSLTRSGTTIRVEMRLFDVRSRQQVLGREYNGAAANPAALRPHHGRRDPPDAEPAARRGAHQAGLLLGSGPRPRRQHRAAAQRQGDLHRRLRRRQPAPRHRQPAAERVPELVARRPRHRLHLVPPRLSRHLHLAHLPGHDGDADQRHRPELAAGVLARRRPHRLHVEPRRQLGDLRDEPRRLRRPAAHQPSGDRRDADLVAVGSADRLHLGSHRHAADLGDRRRRPEPAAADLRVVRRSADVVAGAVQRDRLRRPHRHVLRHQDLPGDRQRDPPDHVRPGHRTRARRGRPTAATSRSCRPGPAEPARSSRSAATARTCVR